MPRAIHSKEILKKAKDLYMDHTPILKIAAETGIPKSTVDYHVQKIWKAQRELNRTELFQALTDARKTDFMEMTHASMKIIKRSLISLAERPSPPTPTEAKQATYILAELDKMCRLDEGKATSIIKNEDSVITIEDLKKKIQNDPFSADIPDAEYKSLPEPSHDSENSESEDKSN